VGSAASGETVVDLEVTGTVRSLPPMVEANLLRVAQEGVANAYRHARASRITLALVFSARSVILSISDDGTGLDNSDSGGHPRERGLAGMKERAAEIGGTLTIQSAPGGGTTVRMEVRG
jgi:signal transduction histidine kinase